LGVENLQITTEQIKELREESKAGVMECRSALIEAEGNKAKALEILQRNGLLKAEKKSGRTAQEGLVYAYIHGGGRIGAMVEVNCETDFVARTPDFQELVKNIAMQVAAMNPQYLSKESCPADEEIDFENACLLLQPYIKDPSRTVQELVTEVISKTGENIVVSRFVRYELGQ